MLENIPPAKQLECLPTDVRPGVVMTLKDRGIVWQPIEGRNLYHVCASLVLIRSGMPEHLTHVHASLES